MPGPGGHWGSPSGTFSPARSGTFTTAANTASRGLREEKIAAIDTAHGTMVGVWGTDSERLGLGALADGFVGLDPALFYFRPVSVHRVTVIGS